jgi:hypothetical protein
MLSAMQKLVALGELLLDLNQGNHRNYNVAPCSRRLYMRDCGSQAQPKTVIVERAGLRLTRFKDFVERSLCTKPSFTRPSVGTKRRIELVLLFLP